MTIHKLYAAMIGTLFASSLAISPTALANDNPFAIKADSITQLADKKDGKCGEGKCGGDKKKDGKCGEGKCGGDKKKSDKKDGKCGEGKCGSDKKKSDKKDGKCGEGKCGGDKKKSD